MRGCVKHYYIHNFKSFECVDSYNRGGNDDSLIRTIMNELGRMIAFRSRGLNYKSLLSLKKSILHESISTRALINQSLSTS